MPYAVVPGTAYEEWFDDAQLNAVPTRLAQIFREI
jgi:hypothetical protein